MIRIVQRDDVIDSLYRDCRQMTVFACAGGHKASLDAGMSHQNPSTLQFIETLPRTARAFWLRDHV